MIPGSKGRKSNASLLARRFLNLGSWYHIYKICASLGIKPDDLEYMVKENTIHDLKLSKEDSELLSKYRSGSPRAIMNL